MIPKQLQTTLIVGLLIIAIIALWTLPKQLANSRTTKAELFAQNCSLNNSSCSVSNDELSVILSASPSPLASLKPLIFLAEIQGEDVKQVILDIKGKDMYMGLNQSVMTLNPVSNKWEATTELAVCSTGVMTWLATVKVLTSRSEKPIEATFEFDAK